jgi:tRNA U38,U39,U40 pseudouridine synthase TruA
MNLLVEKIPKKRFAFLFGYLGTNYSGSAINHSIPLSNTVEGNLFQTFKNLNFISDLNFENSSKIGFNRNSRTDRDLK